MDGSQHEEARRAIAIGCRIMAHAGLAEDVLGHIGARVDGGVLVRCRGPRERGLLYTVPGDVHLVRSDGTVDDDRYSPPKELPIHTSVLRRRPDVGAVVHAHPPEVIAADLAGIPFVPLVGAYNIPAARLAVDGVSVYPRAVLIARSELGDEMTDALGDAPVCVLRGHGLTTVGGDIEQAVVRALAVDSLARMMNRVARLGGDVRAIADADLAELPDLGAAFNTTLIWRHHEERLRTAGLLDFGQTGEFDQAGGVHV